MHLLLLGGNHKSNKDWVKKVETALKGYFESSHVHEYKHWETGDDMINIEHEVEQLMAHIKDTDEKNYVIFAKSMGAVLALKAIAEKKLSPSRCIFAGVAVNAARGEKLPIDEWMMHYNIPSLFFQKTGDPAFSFAELQAWLVLQGAENYTLIEFPGKDHEYEDIESIKKSVTNFLFS